MSGNRPEIVPASGRRLRHPSTTTFYLFSCVVIRDLASEKSCHLENLSFIVECAVYLHVCVCWRIRVLC